MEALKFAGNITLENLVAGVDWLTITAKSQAAREQIFDATKDVLARVRKDAEVKKWKFMGYEGWSCDGIRWGTRADSDICVLSGWEANEAWRTFTRVSGNPTRLDLAVTCDLTKPWSALVDIYYNWIVGNGDLTKARNYTRVDSSRGGSTLYVGSRTSDQFGRVYDKGAEQGIPDPGFQWRYEIELKTYRAQRVWSQLCKYVADDTSLGTVTRSISETVRRWFDARHVPPIWREIDSEAMLLDVSAKVNSDERTLNWLSTQVSPSIAKLTDRGKQNDVLIALGLAHLVQGVERGEITE